MHRRCMAAWQEAAGRFGEFKSKQIPQCLSGETSRLLAQTLTLVNLRFRWVYTEV